MDHSYLEWRLPHDLLAATLDGTAQPSRGGLSMADTELERLKSFRGFIQEAEQGASVPPVSADDLKLLHNVCIEMTKRYSGKDGVITLDVMARSCNPDANLAAVWLRHSRLRLLIRQGLLAEWQHGTDLDDTVYRVAATIPMNGIDLDPETFIRVLRDQIANALHDREP
jgi:hypothetical protein